MKPVAVGAGTRAWCLLAVLAPSVVAAQSALPPVLCNVLPVVQWGAPVDLGEASGDALPAQVAASDNGEAIAVWYGVANRRLGVQVRRFARVSTFTPWWQPAMSLTGLRVGADWAGPSVTMDGSGNALAAWEQPDFGTGNQRIEVSHFARAANGTGQWSAREQLSPASAFARAPVLALRHDGALGLALWQTVVGGKRELHWALYDGVRAKWSSGFAPLVVNVHDDLAPSVAFSTDGYALLAYQSLTGSFPRRVQVFGHWFDPSTLTWSGAQRLDDTSAATPTAALPPRPRVTIDGDGRALATWRHRDAANGADAVYFANFDSASRTWSTPAQTVAGGLVPMPGQPLVSASLGAALAPLAARTSFVLWSEMSAIGANLHATRRANATAPWDPKLRVPMPAIVTSIGDMALAGSTNPSALWVQHRGTGGTNDFGLYASQYVPGGQGCPPVWTGAQHVADVTRRDPRLRTPERAGVPVAVWIQTTGDTARVMASVRSSGRLPGL